MTDSAAFDAFYRDTRERLLLQAYALTGDGAAARSAVRDSYVVAWHHWPKVAGAADPEAALRGIAWAKAQRRHGARLWLRDRGVDPEVRATLDALASLSSSQRRVLLLAHLASVSMPGLAAEVGLTREDAESQLQLATSAFALERDVPSTAVAATLEPLSAVLDDVRWPRATIIRRSGATRRRTHTSLGVLGGVVALLVSGVVVTDASGARPSLDRPLTGVLSADPGEGADAMTTPEVDTGTAARPEQILPAGAMLGVEQVRRGLPGRSWDQVRTDDNSEGTGMVLPCQQERYADPGGEAALVRIFRGPRPQGGGARPEVVQLSEVSGSPRATRRAYATLVDWFAGCAEPRRQLVASRAVGDVGGETIQLVLRGWDRPVRTTVAQVSRTGRVTTAVVGTLPGAGTPDAGSLARLQADAVDGLCDLPDAGPCAGRPRLSSVAPPPTGAVPAMLSEIDLPPVDGVAEPWLGTEPSGVQLNAASTGCDDAGFVGRFEGAPFRQNLTRTFLVPEADLPDRFGLTETIASLPVPQARGFVSRVRSRVAGCPDRDLGTDVSRVAQRDQGSRSLTAWQITTEVSDQRSIQYYMAVLRDGTTVAQVGFVPAPGVGLPDGAFVTLAERALDRLARMPARPAGGGNDGASRRGGNGGGNRGDGGNGDGNRGDGGNGGGNRGDGGNGGGNRGDGGNGGWGKARRGRNRPPSRRVPPATTRPTGRAARRLGVNGGRAGVRRVLRGLAAPRHRPGVRDGRQLGRGPGVHPGGLREGLVEPSPARP